MAKKKKYYVVWQGHDPGIYESWAECQAQIKNYSGAKYKSFPTKETAEEAFHQNYKDFISSKASAPKPIVSPASHPEIKWNSWSVDAACSGNPGKMEYRGVDTQSGDEIFHAGPFGRGTNNIGEFLAIVHALALLQRKEDPSTPIYSDSKIAMGWIRQKKAKTKLKRTPETEHLLGLIKRAEIWLHNNTFSNPIIKWNTEEWGEIPADFGRK